MFRNSTKSVGTIIKLIAAILFCINLLLGIIGAIVLFCLDDDLTLLGILTIILTPLSSILMYLLLYGFGQLVENSDYLVQEHKKAQDNPDNQTTGNTAHFTPVASQNLIIGDWKDRQISVCIYDNFAFSFKGSPTGVVPEQPLA